MLCIPKGPQPGLMVQAMCFPPSSAVNSLQTVIKYSAWIKGQPTKPQGRGVEKAKPWQMCPGLGLQDHAMRFIHSWTLSCSSTPLIKAFPTPQPGFLAPISFSSLTVHGKHSHPLPVPCAVLWLPHWSSGEEIKPARAAADVPKAAQSQHKV